MSSSTENYQRYLESENTITSSTSNTTQTSDISFNDQFEQNHDYSNDLCKQHCAIQSKRTKQSEEIDETTLNIDDINKEHTNDAFFQEHYNNNNKISKTLKNFDNLDNKYDDFLCVYQGNKIKLENVSASVPIIDMNNNKIDKQIETLNNTLIGATKLDFVCSLYVTACPAVNNHSNNEKREAVRKEDLEKAILSIKPSGNFKISETKCGLIASFTQETDADKLLLNINLAEVLHGPVQVARFSRKDSRYKQIATLRDVPWSIPLQDICSALTYQGISFENVDRYRNNVRVEILDANHYENLISQGLNFFDAARFQAAPERWYRNSRANINMNGERIRDTDSILQCYRCQGFWHVAANCRHLPRCVRCGEPHGVEFCPRPRNNPICCHCSGAHHAAYKNCPVRIQLINAIPVSMSLSTTPSSSQAREIRSRCRT